MREKIVSILTEINEDIAGYEGEGLLEDGIIASLDIIEIVSALEDEFGIKIRNQERRGGHNRKTVEVLNTEGYLTAVYYSVKEASEALHISGTTLLYHIDGRSHGLVNGQAVRFRNNK